MDKGDMSSHEGTQTTSEKDVLQMTLSSDHFGI